MSDIRFDFDIAKRQEQVLEDAMYHLEQMVVGKYEPCIAELGQAWQGDESKMFQNTMHMQEEKLLHTVKLIEEAKASLHAAGVRMHNAEENAKEIAETRTYK